MATPPSNRKSKEALNRAARALRAKPGWDPAKFVSEDPLNELRRLDQQSRDHRVYGQSEACAACTKARAEAGDDTALCETHLREAMGF